MVNLLPSFLMKSVEYKLSKISNASDDPFDSSLSSDKIFAFVDFSTLMIPSIFLLGLRFNS